MSSIVVSLRVSSEQAKRLQRKARQLHRTPSDTGALLIEEGLRRGEFAFIDFRDTPVGREAFVQGTRVPVWQVIAILRCHGNDVAKVARYLEWPIVKVKAATNYAKAFSDEVEDAISDNAAQDLESVSRILPNVEEVVVSRRKK